MCSARDLSLTTKPWINPWPTLWSQKSGVILSSLTCALAPILGAILEIQLSLLSWFLLLKPTFFCSVDKAFCHHCCEKWYSTPGPNKSFSTYFSVAQKGNLADKIDTSDLIHCLWDLQSILPFEKRNESHGDNVVHVVGQTMAIFAVCVDVEEAMKQMPSLFGFTFWLILCSMNLIWGRQNQIFHRRNWFCRPFKAQRDKADFCVILFLNQRTLRHFALDSANRSCCQFCLWRRSFRGRRQFLKRTSAEGGRIFAHGHLAVWETWCWDVEIFFLRGNGVRLTFTCCLFWNWMLQPSGLNIWKWNLKLWIKTCAPQNTVTEFSFLFAVHDWSFAWPPNRPTRNTLWIGNQRAFVSACVHVCWQDLIDGNGRIRSSSHHEK